MKERLLSDSFLRIGLVIFFSIVFCWSPSRAQFSKTDSLERLLRSSSQAEKVTILCRLAKLTGEVNRAAGIKYAEEALLLSRKINYVRGQFDASIILASFFTDTQGSRGLQYAGEAYRLSLELKDDWCKAKSLQVSGNLYLALRWNSLSMKSLTGAFDLFKKLKLDQEIGETEILIGTLYSRSKHFAEGLIHLRRANAIFAEMNNQLYLGIVHHQISSLYYEQQKFDSALQFCSKAIDALEKSHSPRHLSSATNVLARVYLAKGDYANARKVAFRELVLSREANRKESEAQGLITLGQVDQFTGNPSRAITYFEKAANLDDSVSDIHVVMQTYQGLTAAYMAVGQLSKALDAELRLEQLEDTLRSRTQESKMAELKYEFETELSEERIRLLEKERSFYEVLFSLGAVSLVLAGAIVFILVQVRKSVSAKQKLIDEAEKKKIESEIKVKKLNEEKLVHEVHLKNRQLTASTLKLIQKKEVIDSVMKHLEEIKGEGHIDAKVLDGLFEKSLEGVDQDWENFKGYFEEVHAGFFNNLKRTFANVTPGESKLAALLRLNLDTKQIAPLLDITPESVKVMRHRLRKKIGVPEDENLLDFLSQFDRHEISNVA